MGFCASKLDFDWTYIFHHHLGTFQTYFSPDVCIFGIFSFLFGWYLFLVFFFSNPRWLARCFTSGAGGLRVAEWSAIASGFHPCTSDGGGPDSPTFAALSSWAVHVFDQIPTSPKFNNPSWTLKHPLFFFYQKKTLGFEKKGRHMWFSVAFHHIKSPFKGICFNFSILSKVK